MKLYALSDLHLSHDSDKPMSVFGNHWENHMRKIELACHEAISAEDTLIIAGDISWGMSLDEAISDLKFIDSLPGQKILLRGNHDYWWSTLRKMEQRLAAEGCETISFLRNNALTAAGFLIGGTRGWLLPGDENFKSGDVKIYQREIERLSLSLAAMEALAAELKTVHTPLVAIHYPPISSQGRSSELAEKLSAAGISTCIYGHIHHNVPLYRSNPVVDGVRYVLTAADQIDFKPLLLGEDGVFADFQNR